MKTWMAKVHKENELFFLVATAAAQRKKESGSVCVFIFQKAMKSKQQTWFKVAEVRWNDGEKQTIECFNHLEIIYQKTACAFRSLLKQTTNVLSLPFGNKLTIWNITKWKKKKDPYKQLKANFTSTGKPSNQTILLISRRLCRASDHTMGAQCTVFLRLKN